MKTVISLCDITGHMVQPWVDAGYHAVLVDPQHGFSDYDTRVTKIALTVEQAMPHLTELLRDFTIAAVFAFPVCKELAGSGAKHWAKKRAADYMFQAKAVSLAEQCRTIGRLSGAPYMVENPVGALSRVFGKADHIFHPWQYTAWERADHYTKKTCLWTGNGFVMPAPRVDPTLTDPPDDRIHKAPPGPDRENFRSATPLGFARAVFDANARQEKAA